MLGRGERNYYKYKDKVYHCWGTKEDELAKVKNPTTGEWFQAVRYRPVISLTDSEGKEYFTISYEENYYREVNDFVKKFKKTNMKGKKEI